MITVLHGDNTLASRNVLNNLIDQAKSKLSSSLELLRLDGTKLQPEELIQTLESNALFAVNRLIIIENLFSQIKSKNKNQLIEYFSSQEFSEKSVVLWERKSITPANLKKLTKLNAQIQLFKTPPIIFKFLDSFKPNNQKIVLSFYHQCLKDSPAEMIFYMLHRRISQLIQAKDEKHKLKAAPWQINRLKSQAKNFDLNQLLKIHSQLLKIDYQIKKGKNITPLSTQLDFFLMDI